jgi:nucleoside-diphosphate-sugar epimerase
MNTISSSFLCPSANGIEPPTLPETIDSNNIMYDFSLYKDRITDKIPPPNLYMINELKIGHDVNVYDGGNMYRDYIHVNDAVDAIKLILDKGETNSIYNVSNGEPLLFKDLIEYAKELIVGEGELRPIEVPEFHRIVQVHSQWMKNDKLKALGYEPKYDMKSIIEDMVR